MYNVHVCEGDASEVFTPLIINDKLLLDLKTTKFVMLRWGM